MDRETLIKILRGGCRAPSGDNVQPWRFSWDGVKLSIYNIPDIHNPHLDFEERGSYIAHGALIENIEISAQHYGHLAQTDVFPEKSLPDLVARITFESISAQEDPLFVEIESRSTNRHHYKIRPLSEEERVDLSKSVENISTVEFHLATNRTAITKLAYAASRAEIVILEDESVAAHFFGGMVWTHAEEIEKKAGFYVKTMEFNPVQSFVFWLASKPRIMSLFRKVGLPRFIADEDAKLYATGSAIGAVFVPDESGVSFIKAGRALERLWLTASKRGLAFQPLIGMSFIAHRSQTNRGALSNSHNNEMTAALRTAREEFGNPNGILAFLFRVGEAPHPTARTSRRDPSIEFV